MENKSPWRILFVGWSLIVFSYLIQNEEVSPVFNPLWVVSHGIHEIGHWVTRPFGDWISVASGTAFELIFPWIFVVGMLRSRDLHGAFVIFTWYAATLLHSAHYAGSAEYSGPLLDAPFGHKLYHDWVWMLSRLDATHRARDIEDIFFALAIGFCVLSILGQLFSLSLLMIERRKENA